MYFLPGELNSLWTHGSRSHHELQDGSYLCNVYELAFRRKPGGVNIYAGRRVPCFIARIGKISGNDDPPNASFLQISHMNERLTSNTILVPTYVSVGPRRMLTHTKNGSQFSSPSHILVSICRPD